MRIDHCLSVRGCAGTLYSYQNLLLTLTIPHVNKTPGLPRRALCVRKFSRQFMIVGRHLPARLTEESQTIYN